MQQVIVQPAALETQKPELVDQDYAEPEVSYHYIDLPKTRLHYLKSGEGPPMVIVPATISRIENWRSLAQFMAQKFTVYFFELPGHGKSSPFQEAFRTQLVAETVEALVDRLKHETFSLMGFSFGGILAMETLRLLQERVQKVVLIAPALSRNALQFARGQLWLLCEVVKLLEWPKVRSAFLRLIRSKTWSPVLATIMARIANVEKNVSISQIFNNLTDSTADVLTYQLDELLNFEPRVEAKPFSQPCFCAMSVNDPMLNFQTTVSVLKKHFKSVHIERFTHPYHQPPRQLTFLEIAQQYSPLLDQVAST